MEPLQSTPTPASVSIPAPAPRSVDEPVEIEPCPKCSTKLSVSGSDIGNDVECPYCKTVFQAIKPGSRPQAPPPAPSRKSQFESTDDNGRPKSRRKDSDDDDDRPRKRRRDVDDDDEEDEIPKIKSISESRRRDEEDDYDSPKSKNKSRRRDEDDEDAPKSKSRRRDEEDEDYDDRPRKRRYRSGGNGRRVTITRVNVLATGKVMAMMLAVTMFIVMLFVVLIGLAFGSTAPRAGGNGGPDIVGMIFSGGIIALVVAPIAYGIGGFIYGVILALIYNAASGIAGGFEMEIEEE